MHLDQMDRCQSSSSPNWSVRTWAMLLVQRKITAMLRGSSASWFLPLLNKKLKVGPVVFKAIVEVQQRLFMSYKSPEKGRKEDAFTHQGFKKLGTTEKIFLSFTATRMGPEVIILREISQAQKEKYCMFSLVCRSFKKMISYQQRVKQ